MCSALGGISHGGPEVRPPSRCSWRVTVGQGRHIPESLPLLCHHCECVRGHDCVCVHVCGCERECVLVRKGFVGKGPLTWQVLGLPRQAEGQVLGGASGTESTAQFEAWRRAASFAGWSKSMIWLENCVRSCRGWGQS